MVDRIQLIISNSERLAELLGALVSGLLGAVPLLPDSTRPSCLSRSLLGVPCPMCGLTRDFDSEELNTLSIPASVADFGSVDATRVEVRGVCRRCAGEQTEGTNTSERNEEPVADDPGSAGDTKGSKS